jgi:hypothetical protein
LQPLETLPCIEDILPQTITPSFLMKDVKLAKAYTTKSLSQASQPRTPKKPKRPSTLPSPKAKRTKVGDSDAQESTETLNPKENESGADHIQISTMGIQLAKRQLHHPPGVITGLENHLSEQIITESQSMRLQLRIIQQEFVELNKLLLPKKITKKLKDRLALFGDLLKTVTVSKNIFEPDTVRPDPTSITDEQYGRFDTFYKTFLKLCPEDTVIDESTHKFLIYLHQTDPSDLNKKFEDFEFDGNSKNDVEENVAHIKKWRKQLKMKENKNKSISPAKRKKKNERKDDEQEEDVQDDDNDDNFEDNKASESESDEDGQEED